MKSCFCMIFPIIAAVSSHVIDKSKDGDIAKRMKNSYNLITTVTKDGDAFGYDGNVGPLYWGDMYHSCNGLNQSPININSSDVTEVTLKPLKFTKFNAEFNNAFIINNGHTVMVSLNIDQDEKPTISGGPLEGDEYEFHQYHFHWGENNLVGSEFMVNGKRFPLEMHMVFFNKKYENFDKALDHFDGLCVLGVFFEISPTDNPAFKFIVADSLRNVIFTETTFHLTHHPQLGDLIPDDTEHYYTLHGSLTTPPCLEVVTWIDFQKTIPISSAQLKEFRFVENDAGHQIQHNFRPIQAINNRVVLNNIRNDKSHGTVSVGFNGKGFILTMLILVLKQLS